MLAVVSLNDELRGMLHKVDVDRAIFYEVLGRLLDVATGPVTAFSIVARFTPEYQGYHTFGSLLVLQVFSELGSLALSSSSSPVVTGLN